MAQRARIVADDEAFGQVALFVDHGDLENMEKARGKLKCTEATRMFLLLDIRHRKRLLELLEPEPVAVTRGGFLVLSFAAAMMPFLVG